MTVRTLLSSHGLPIPNTLPVLTLSDSQNTRGTHCLPRHTRISPKRPITLPGTFKHPTCTPQTTRLHFTNRFATSPLVSLLLYPIPYTPPTTPSPVLPSALPHTPQNTRAHILFYLFVSPSNTASPSLFVSTCLTLTCFCWSCTNRYTTRISDRPTVFPKRPLPVYC